MRHSFFLINAENDDEIKFTDSVKSQDGLNWTSPLWGCPVLGIGTPFLNKHSWKVKTNLFFKIMYAYVAFWENQWDNQFSA